MRRSRYPLWCLLLAGYLSAGRNFCYLGVPPLFISEAYLGWSIFRNRGNWLGRFADDILRGELLSVAIGLNLLWGLVEVFRCLGMGRPPIEVFRTFALSYYPLYLLVGISIGREMTMDVFVRGWKIIFFIYAPWATVGYVFFLEYAGFSGIPSVLPVAMISLWPYLRNWWPRYFAFLASLYPILFTSGHGRAGTLSLVAGLALVIVSSGMNLGRFLAIATTVLVIGFAIGPYIPSPTGGGPPLDPVVHTARAVATFDTDLAKKMLLARGYTQEWESIEGAEGTTRWRKIIWANVIKSLNSTELWIFGQGGGANIAQLVPDHQEIHTPHNFTIFCLYYVGVVGLALYLFLLLAVVLASRRVENLRFRALLLGAIASTVVMALVGDCFETPYGAVPLFLVCGITLGLAQSTSEQRTSECRANSAAAAWPRRPVRIPPGAAPAAARSSS